MKTAKYLIILPLLWGCGGVGGGNKTAPEGSSGTEEGNNFPSQLAVTSPLDLAEAGSSGSALAAQGEARRFISRFEEATGQIEEVLNGSSAEDCFFDPNLYLTQDVNARCFGPTVAYEAHPDATGPDDLNDSGQLPSGDVGIWTETDETGPACSAAELNARMQGARHKGLASLMGIASLVCVARVNEIPLPTDGSLDLTAEMNGLEIPDVLFRSATIAHTEDSGETTWSYDLDFDYTREAEDHRVVVSMIHQPGDSPLAYSGTLTYLVNNSFEGGNCPTSEVTDNGSLVYERGSETELALQMRNGQFCGHDSNGLADGQVDPSQKYNEVNGIEGWGNNFSILTADFDPTSMTGNYSYAWQAGPGDRSARIFNIAVEGSESAEAFFGYGEDIEATDGSIEGFFCNWAGPGNGHDLLPLAQRQTVSLDESTGTFASTEAQILYAVTNDCDYDGLGDFTYDSDLDGVVDTDPADPIAHELIDLVDEDGDGLLDAIAESGFVLPEGPSGVTEE